MRFNQILTRLALLILLGNLLFPFHLAQANSRSAPAQEASAYELILAMNTLRVSYGNPPLIEDPIINAVAQYTAQVMADNQMSWHIGDVRGRLAAAGYGGGGTVWATENFAVGTSMGIDQIMAAWADPDHMRPAVTAAYCHVGAGVATAANGRIYYVLQAAYTSEQACGSYSPGPGLTPGSSSGYVPQYIVPVKIATPDAEGNLYHIVQTGQSFWSIAIAYQITIADLEKWNNLSRESPLKAGQKLYIPGENTAGYATPTPVGMIVPSAPDADGRIIHQVQAYQALTTIAQAYGVTIDRILALNGLQADWPLQIGQKLLIDPGHITPSPTLSTIQRLTPEADGKYYHTVHDGETLSWIAGYYGVSLENLLLWNGLGYDSLILPNQKLLLLVTPPASETPTAAPPTATRTPQPSPSPTPPLTDQPPLAVPETQPASAGARWVIALVMLIVAAGLGGAGWFLWSKREPP